MPIIKPNFENLIQDVKRLVVSPLSNNGTSLVPFDVRFNFSHDNYGMRVSTYLLASSSKEKKQFLVNLNDIECRELSEKVKQCLSHPDLKSNLENSSEACSCALILPDVSPRHFTNLCYNYLANQEILKMKDPARQKSRDFFNAGFVLKYESQIMSHAILSEYNKNNGFGKFKLIPGKSLMLNIDCGSSTTTLSAYACNPSDIAGEENIWRGTILECCDVKGIGGDSLTREVFLFCLKNTLPQEERKELNESNMREVFLKKFGKTQKDFIDQLQYVQRYKEDFFNSFLGISDFLLDDVRFESEKADILFGIRDSIGGRGGFKISSTDFFKLREKVLKPVIQKCIDIVRQFSDCQRIILHVSGGPSRDVFLSKEILNSILQILSEKHKAAKKLPWKFIHRFVFVASEFGDVSFSPTTVLARACLDVIAKDHIAKLLQLKIMCNVPNKSEKVNSHKHLKGFIKSTQDGGKVL